MEIYFLDQGLCRENEVMYGLVHWWALPPGTDWEGWWTPPTRRFDKRRGSLWWTNWCEPSLRAFLHARNRIDVEFQSTTEDLNSDQGAGSWGRRGSQGSGRGWLEAGQVYHGLETLLTYTTPFRYHNIKVQLRVG